MQAITPELEAILKAKFQAGASGFRGRVEIDTVSRGVGPFVNASSADAKVWVVSNASGTTGGTPTGWQAPGFDDTAWDDPDVFASIDVVEAVLPALMITPHEAVVAADNDPMVWLARIPFILGSIPTEANLYVSHDDGAQFYINGTLVWSDTGDGTHPSNTTARVVTSAPFVIGENVLAVTVANATYGSHAWVGNPTWVEYRLLTDVDPVLATDVYRPKRISIDKSLRLVADQATVEFENEDLPLGWGTSSLFPTNSRMRAYQWFGDAANEVLVFTGLIDAVVDSRDPLTTAISCRDLAAILLDQTFGATAPQGAEETGAVRTAANGVYLNMEVSDIVEDILDRAGWPVADRAVSETSYVLAEYIIPDGMSWAEAIIGDERLSGLVGYDAWAGESGTFHFAPTFTAGALTEPGVPAYTFESGVDIVSLQDATDQYDLRTRVKVRGPLTTATLTDTWRELWRTSKIAHPVGIWYDPADSANIRVIDSGNKRLYKVRQSDRVVLSYAYLGGVIPYPVGLSGDPSDSTIYWVLNAPWYFTGATTGNSVRKVRKADNVQLASYALPDGRWTALKVSAAYLWLTNWDTDRFYSRSKADASAVANYQHTVGATVQLNPTGLMVDGTTLYLFWRNAGTTARFLVCSESAPGTIAKTVKTAGTTLYGGEMDTTTHTECWGDNNTLGLLAKFTLVDVGSITEEVFAEVVDTDLEDELGALAQSKPREHDTHPAAADHAYEIRRDTLDVTAVTSLAQATETAMRRLDKLGQRRRVLDAGIIGNPALQKTDLVRVEDPKTGIAEDWTIDTYRSEMSADGTYLGTLALLPVSTPGDTPTDDGDAT